MIYCPQNHMSKYTIKLYKSYHTGRLQCPFCNSTWASVNNNIGAIVLIIILTVILGWFKLGVDKSFHKMLHLRAFVQSYNCIFDEHFLCMA